MKQSPPYQYTKSRMSMSYWDPWYRPNWNTVTIPEPRNISKPAGSGTTLFLKRSSAMQKGASHVNRCFDCQTALLYIVEKMFLSQELQDQVKAFWPVRWEGRPVCWALK